MKKIGIFCILTLFLFQLAIISAIGIEVQEEEISDIAIVDINEPAVYELTIKNLENSTQSFEIYTLVGKVSIEQEQEISVAPGESESVKIYIHADGSTGYYSFEYKIKNDLGDIHAESLSISILELEDVIEFYTESITIDSEKAEMHFVNKAPSDFMGVEAQFSGVFFDDSEVFNLPALSDEIVEVDIQKDNTKSLLAGPYIVTVELILRNETIDLSSVIKFIEKSGIDTVEANEGFLLKRQEITKTNLGNVRTETQVVIEKNILSSMFTTFNIPYTNKNSDGLLRYYIFEEKLGPGESLEVVSKTNWWILFIVVVCVAAIVLFSRHSANSKLKLMKKVSFVKTKGGEFALKVSIVVKAREYVERIKVVDKLPGMVKLYERYGTISPDRVDHKNKRLEWNIENLNKGEERIFSYIIYSKVGVIGKFELPEAEAIYEYQGKVKDAISNRSFFINEPDKKPRVQKMVDDLL